VDLIGAQPGELSERAFEHHFWPDTISTDPHRYSADAPWRVTLPGAISKRMPPAMSLHHVAEKAASAGSAGWTRARLRFHCANDIRRIAVYWGRTSRLTD